MPKVNSSGGPVAVTGASGYIGSHVVAALAGRGYDVRACVTDGQNAAKTEHLVSLNSAGLAGRVEILPPILARKRATTMR